MYKAKIIDYVESVANLKQPGHTMHEADNLLDKYYAQ